MRKILAKDVEWTMGSTGNESSRNQDENTHKVTLTNNYYIGVFEVTQTQWKLVQPNYADGSHFANPDCRAMRPVENVSYNEIRMAANSVYMAASAREWPEPPYSGSFLNLLRIKTGIDFDLPSEAQWEFAARAGNGDSKWGNGESIKNETTDENLHMYGRYKHNGGYVNGTAPSASCDVANGTATVGTYVPNSWGLYDMGGNVYEWCLDWYADDITTLNGAVNTYKADNLRVLRSGSWMGGANGCRPACRYKFNPTYRNNFNGLRVICTAGLQ
jgi:formylglycine-generating enzyme required for sulfatase activity